MGTARYVEKEENCNTMLIAYFSVLTYNLYTPVNGVDKAYTIVRNRRV